MVKSKKDHYYLSSLSLSKGLLTGVTRGEGESRGTIIFVFFLAYFTCRYAAWLATRQVSEVSARRTFDIASAVFIVSSVWGVAANRQAAYLPDQSLETPTRDILWTSALVASGAFAGSCSITTIISGLLCGLWTTMLASLNVNINKCASYGVHMMGGIVGGLATGNVVTDSNVSIGVAHGIILAVVVSIVVSELGANITIILEGFVNTCMADLSPTTVVGVTVGVGGGLASWIVNGFVKGMIIGFPSGFVGTLVAVVLVLMMATYFVENNKPVQN